MKEADNSVALPEYAESVSFKVNLSVAVEVACNSLSVLRKFVESPCAFLNELVRTFEVEVIYKLLVENDSTRRVVIKVIIEPVT